jgi:hypothetical protein
MSINRIAITIPGSSSSAAGQRDEEIGRLAGLGITFDFYRYQDTRSGLGMWGYYAYGYAFNSGICTVATVTCAGMATPPTGSDQVAMADPGPGATYTWNGIGAPQSIMTEDDSNAAAAPGQNSYSSASNRAAGVPPQDNNYWTWRIAANSGSAPADFTAAITEINARFSAANSQYFKYVDAVSGAWAVYAVWTYFATNANAPVRIVLTCSGSPNPPTGSSLPAVAMPAFTQTFVTLHCPLSYGPGR